MDAGEWGDVATYLAEGRLRPMVQLGMKRRELTDYDMELTEAVIEALPEILGKAANDQASTSARRSVERQCHVVGRFRIRGSGADRPSRARRAS